MRLRVDPTAWDESNAHSKRCDVSDHALFLLQPPGRGTPFLQNLHCLLLGMQGLREVSGHVPRGMCAPRDRPAQCMARGRSAWRPPAEQRVSAAITGAGTGLLPRAEHGFCGPRRGPTHKTRPLAAHSETRRPDPGHGWTGRAGDGTRPPCAASPARRCHRWFDRT